MASNPASGFPVRLIVGLGNVGEKYEKTRHNAGFWFLDALAAAHAVSFGYDAKFYGQTARINMAGKPCYLLKPHTFVNRSGQAVSAALNYYKISPTNMLVVHDDLDFDVGVVRLKQQGGHGGHNGLRDIIKSTGEKGFLRLRIGIGHPREVSSGHGQDVSGFVLGVPGRSEREKFEDAVGNTLSVLPLLWEKGLEAFTQRLHQ